MAYICTVEAMRECDRRAIEKYGIPGLILMENAGRELAEVAIWTLSEHDPIGIVCGSGNNGGDGFVAARHLVQQGREVRVYLTHSAEEVLDRDGDASANLGILQSSGFDIREIPEDVEGWRGELAECTGLIDAVFGTGLSRPVEGRMASILDAMIRTGNRIVAADIPSGIHGDTGEVLGTAIQATATVSFAALKPGLTIDPGKSHAGEVHVAQIGIPNALLNALATTDR